MQSSTLVGRKIDGKSSHAKKYFDHLIMQLTPLCKQGFFITLLQRRFRVKNFLFVKRSKRIIS